MWSFTAYEATVFVNLNLVVLFIQRVKILTVTKFASKFCVGILIRARNISLNETFRTSINEDRKIYLVFKRDFHRKSMLGTGVWTSLLKCHTSPQIPDEKLQSNADVPTNEWKKEEKRRLSKSLSRFTVRKWTAGGTGSCVVALKEVIET